jgi:methyl-accepting chemotaxis protein
MSSHPAPAGRRRGPSRRTIGKAMIGIGVLGVLVSAAAVIIGQSLVRQVETSVDDSLVVTDRALTAVIDSISVTGRIVDTVKAGVTSIGETVGTLQSSLEQSSTAIGDVSTFVGTSLPDALASVNGVLPTIKSVADTIDTTLEALDDIPFGPDYNPATSFGDAIGSLQGTLAPLPDQLRGLASDFTDVTASTSTIHTQLTALSTDITELSGQLVEVSTLVDTYAKTAADASVLAQSSRHDLADSARLTRWLLTLLGIVFALGQLVPIWLGITLLRSGPDHLIIAKHT